MNVTCAMLARYADLSPGGGLHVLHGDIDTIRIQGVLPAVLSLPLYYVVKLSVPLEEAKPRHRFRVELLDSGDKLIYHVESELEGKLTGATKRTVLSTVITMVGLRFPAAGVHTFRMLVDGVEVTRTPLYVDAVGDEAAQSEGN